MSIALEPRAGSRAPAPRPKLKRSLGLWMATALPVCVSPKR